MTLPQLQSFLNIFGNPQNTTHTVVVCPDGETFHFGSDEKSDPLMLYIKNLQMVPMFTRNHSKGLESSYLRGYWDCNNIPKLLSISENPNHSCKPAPLKKYHLSPLNPLKLRNFPADAERLESLSLEFHAAWLDPSLTHGIAQFRHGKKDPLYVAQQRRLQSMLKTLQHRYTISVLETHASWGAFTEKSCIHHDLTSTTLSLQHAEFCKNRLHNVPFPINYQIKTKKYCYDSYREFDAVVSILPDVLHKRDWHHYLHYIEQHLKQRGIAILQLIFDQSTPHKTIGSLLTKYGFRILEHSSINHDAAKTYRYWLNNFSANYNQLEKHGFSEQFLRQWKFYLSEIAFYFSNDSLKAHLYLIEKI